MTAYVHEDFKLNGKRYIIRADDDHQSEGTFAYDTEAETAEAVEHEQSRLDSGEYLVVGVEEQEQCGSCKEWHYVDSCWGIVIRADDDISEQALNAL